MKKRIVLAVLTAVLLMTSAMTAFAQPSSEANPISIISATDKKDKDLQLNSQCHEIRITDLKGNELNLAKDIIKPENLKKVIGEADAKKDWTSFMMDVLIWDVEDSKEVEMSEAEYHFPITITFKVPGVTAKSAVKVLHYYPDSWHEEDSVKDVVVGEGTVTVTFAHLSPVVIMVDNPKVPSAPQTGEGNIVLYVALVAIIAVSGAIAIKKTAKA
jgi:hypothetical protein